MNMAMMRGISSITAGHLDGQGQDLGIKAIRDQAEQQTQDGTHDNGLAKDAEAFLHAFGIPVDIAYAGDLLHDPVQTFDDRHTGNRPALWNGDARGS